MNFINVIIILKLLNWYHLNLYNNTFLNAKTTLLSVNVINIFIYF